MKILLLIGFALASLACEHPENKGVVARVNGEAITANEFKLRLRELSLADTSPTHAEGLALKNQLLNELIEEKVLLQEARSRKISISQSEIDVETKKIKQDYSAKDFEAILREQGTTRSQWEKSIATTLTIKKVLLKLTEKVDTPTEEELSAYFDKNKEVFFQRASVHLQQIVVNQKTEGENIRLALLNGEDFSTLAREKSITPEATRGGDLGFVPLDSIPQQVNTRVKQLGPGEMSQVFKSEYGYHIVRVIKRMNDYQPNFAEVRPNIIEIVSERKKKEKLKKWRYQIFSKTKVERNDVLLEQLS